MARQQRSLTISAASQADLDAIMKLLEAAREWQRRKGVDVWHEPDRSLVATDITDGYVFVGRIAKEVCGTITLRESDPLVWGAHNQTALYVHRLVASRTSSELKVGEAILQWARRTAIQRGKQCLRLDTWDKNEGMHHYYERQGFRHVRDVYFPGNSLLPADYRGTHKSLFQLDLR